MSARAQLIVASVATVGVSTLAVTTPVQPPTPKPLEFKLTAQDQPLAEPTEYFSGLLAQSQELAGGPVATANIIPLPPGPPTPDPIGATDSIGVVIEEIYDAVEPWVRYGFELLEYAVGWVPIVGIFAPQIIIVYDFWETIVESVVFNFADFIDGEVTFLQGLSNIGTATWDAFVQLGVDEVNWIRSLLPPLPPLPFAAQPQRPVGATTAAISDISDISDTAEAPATAATVPAGDAAPIVAPGPATVRQALREASQKGNETLTRTVDDIAAQARAVADDALGAASETLSSAAETIRDLGPQRNRITRSFMAVPDAGGDSADVSADPVPNALRNAMREARQAPGKIASAARDSAAKLAAGATKTRNGIRSAVRDAVPNPRG